MDKENLPPALKAKFNPDGSARPFAGNTVICQIQEDCALFAELLAIHEQLQGAGYAAKLSLLPPDSYHMTVFDGVVDRDRATWPSGLNAGITIEACNAEIERRLSRLRFDEPCRFRMRLSPCDIMGPFNTLRLDLVAVDDAENTRIRAMRNRLSEMSGIRAPNHDTYDFHISLAYLIDWPSPDEHADMKRDYAEWRDRILMNVPEFELGPLEYCVFDDMWRFERRM